MKPENLIFKAIALFIGLGLFLYTIDTLGGIGIIVRQLGFVGGGYFWVVANSFLWTFLYALAWKQFFIDVPHTLRYRDLLKIKISGEAVNYMTPLGFVAGDPIRVFLLKHFMGPDARLRSVVVDRCMHSLSAQFFCLVGLTMLFFEKIAFPLWLHALLLAIYLTAFCFLTSLTVSLLTGRGFGFFDPIFHYLRVSQRFPKLSDKLNKLRENLGYYKDKPKRVFWYAFFLHFLGRILGAVEVMIIFYCFEGRPAFFFAMIITTLTSFFSVVFGFIPGAVGILETLYAEFSKLYGFRPEMGLTIQIVRRLRVFFWIFLGILLTDIAAVRHHLRGTKRP